MSLTFMHTAMEACATCNNGKGADGKVINGYDGKNDPKAITNTGHTYADGSGVKDTVMIDGPLSEAFTHALNYKLKKQPLQEEPDQPDLQTQQEKTAEQNKDDNESPLKRQHSVEQIGMATESMQVDESDLQVMIREFDEHSAEVQFVANKFDFMTPAQLPINVGCQVTLISMTDFLSPSKVWEVMERAENTRTEKILVVVSDSLGRASGQTTQERLVDIQSTGAEYAKFKDHPEFNAAVENFFTPIKMKVVVGLEGFFAAIEDYYASKTAQ